MNLYELRIHHLSNRDTDMDTKSSNKQYDNKLSAESDKHRPKTNRSSDYMYY